LESFAFQWTKYSQIGEALDLVTLVNPLFSQHNFSSHSEAPGTASRPTQQVLFLSHNFYDLLFIEDATIPVATAPAKLSTLATFLFYWI
jgi:hypothetical protein